MPGPPPVGPLDLLALYEWRNQLKRARSKESFTRLLLELEVASPLSAAASECPFFALMPPIVEGASKWARYCEEAGVPAAAFGELLQHGFMPMSRELFMRKTLTDPFSNRDVPGDHVLLDIDYGLAVLPGAAGYGNMTLDRAMLERFQRIHAAYRADPSMILAVGAYRAFAALKTAGTGTTATYEFDVSSRAELDRLVERVIIGIQGTSAQLWYRGQAADYLLPDFSRQAFAGICPWRSVRDTSLIPSVYRSAWNGNGTLRAYCKTLIELHEYVLFMKHHLAITEYTSRTSASEPPVEKLSEAWGAYAIGPTVTQSDARGISAIRDYHPAFHGLQESFFLQHYGLPSNILDITSDIETALYFAQNEVVQPGGKIAKVDFSKGTPVLYFFLLVPGLDRFLDSRRLSEHYHLERPLRQSCGLLCGASFITRAYYSRFIAIKVRLHVPIAYDKKITTQYVYPNRTEDPFLDRLLQFQESEHLETVRPFTPQ